MSELPRIPGYKLIRKLGQGGMADVFLGVQENLDRKVAIKVLVPSLFRDKQFSVRFIKEAQTAAQLTHPNIITIHDIGKTGDSHFIVMEYLAESLSDRMRNVKNVEPDEALRIVREISAALDYAHKKGFIHRDIKPDNIMFRPDNTPVLVDFGIARAIDSTTQLTRTGMSIGTPHYMSPEQCRGEKIDGRSDIYSLGVQFYELLTGSVPYKAENTAGIILKHIQAPVPELPAQFSRYQPLINRMMAKERDLRTATGKELINFIDGMITAQQAFPTMPLSAPEMTTGEQPTMVTPTTPVSPVKVIPPTTPQPQPAHSVSSQFRREKKKGPLIAALVSILVVALGVTVYIIIQNPFNDTGTGGIAETTEIKSKTETGSQTVTKPPLEKKVETGKTQTDFPTLVKKDETIDEKTGTQEIKTEEKTEPETVEDPAGKEEPTTPKEEDISTTPAEKDIEVKEKEKTAEQELKETVKKQPPPSRLDTEYNDYVQKAREALKKGNLNDARENIEKAGKRKQTPELAQLVNELQEAHQKRLREQQKKVKPPKKEIKPPAPIVTMLSLHPDLRKSYNEQLRKKEVQLPRRALVRMKLTNVKLTVKGQVTLKLFINENGKVAARLFDDMLTVAPSRAKESIKALILREINTIFLKPPKNKYGKSIRVRDWRVTFKVGKLFNKIYLTKQ